jgi:2-polyprenyl-6-methoxyphenol hydroxylase-like FAD-dependent oxidoreductase
MAVDVSVLVVGAGPTGLLLAAELQRRGVACRIIDAQPAPLHWDRATVVHPRSLEVFESLGILEPVLAAGVKQRRVLIHSAGQVLGEIDLSLSGSRHAFCLGLSEEVTESILTDYLRKQGGDVIRSSRLVEFEDNPDGLVATIQRDGATERVSVRWVVGCDGFHSSARKWAGIELKGQDIPEPWAVFDATTTGWPLSYEANYGYLDEVVVILTSLPGRRWRVYLRPSGPNSDLVADASATVRRYLPAIQFDDVANPTRFYCHSKVAMRYRSGRILLAGDAAHVCTPAEGHGMNSGIQDAFNLAWKLALVCQAHSPPALLDSYEAERRPVAEAIVASGDEAERAEVLTDPAQRRARDETLRTMLADPKDRYRQAVAEAELDIDYGNSPIVMGERHEALAPGQRMPNTIEITCADGQAGLLHELTHRAGHTALLIGGASVPGDQLGQLAGAIRAQSDAAIIEATVSLTARCGEPSLSARLAPPAAEQLGIGDITLLVIRPDGHVGLRADGDHLAALTAYQTLLKSGRS